MMNRIHILDELRGLCVVLMVIYHALYTLATQFMMPFALKLYTFFYPIEPLFAGIFIALCGFSCRLSRSNCRRGLLLAVLAVGMTAVLWIVMPSQVIWFGVLHCLAFCILLFATTKSLLDRVPPTVGAIVCITLFALTWTIPLVHGGTFLMFPIPDALLECKALFPLGFGRVYSADYFPLIPWLFLFFGGTFLGQFREKLPPWCTRSHVPFLAVVGRYSLWIYLLHQPLIFGIATVFSL